jgi:aspartyl-tRNA(Asn)/glutamyl-tRNA(Gln) amidotransferase subunit C
MPLSPEQVLHVARLAHLALSEEEVEEMTHELSTVLDHIDRLQAVDTSDVEGTFNLAPTSDAMRDDESRSAWSTARVLANAPRSQDHMFVVSAVLD